MSERIGKDKLVERITQRIGNSAETVEKIVDATLEEIYAALRQGECVSLKNFGTFYPRNACASCSVGHPLTRAICKEALMATQKHTEDRNRETTLETIPMALRPVYAAIVG